MGIIKLKNVSKFYYSKGVIASGFTKINLEFKMGEFVAITGESGSGKSTLLNVISGLDTYEEGEMYINGEETSHYTEKDFEEYRRKYIGNIFQNFNLVNSYTVYQNIELVLILNGYKKKEIKEKILDLIDKVGLYKFRNTKVSKLSGGQKQRVAIARALAKDTPIIIADEPTGNLDSSASEGIIKLLSEIAKDKLVIIVTHNYEQVEKYVTRKIKMHDGRVLEDKKIKDIDESKNITLSTYKNISLFNKIKIGIRNAFNIVPKFLLVLAVYLFMVFALVSEYTSCKQDEYNSSLNGYNTNFKDTDDTRIVFKKSNGDSISEDDFDKILNINHVGTLYKNDLLIDTEFYLEDNNYFWIYGNARDLDKIDSVDVGRLPENDYEIVIEGYKDIYYFNSMLNELLESNMNISLNNGDKIEGTFKITGIKYIDSYTENSYFYISNNILDQLRNKLNKNYSNITVTFLNRVYEVVEWNKSYSVVPNKKVPKGQVYIPEDYRWECNDGNCYNNMLTIDVTNLYFTDKLSVRPTKYYTRDNYNKLLGLNKNDYDYNIGEIYINEDDYNNLFNKNIYQSSVYVSEEKYLDEVNNTLKDMGYTTLTMREARVEYSPLEVLQLIKTCVTITVAVILFFISYFVIKLILKSRNVYFATIRMLGANKSISRQLIIIELLTISNLAYLTLPILIALNNFNVINVEFINKITYYLSISDFILLYVIITLISFLVSLKFAKGLFKNSTMSTLREEA